jgi:hypothetical protein
MHIFNINTNVLALCQSDMFTGDRQAREAYRCINIKENIYRTNAKIWFNKIAKHIIKPKFVNIRIKEMINIVKNVRSSG